MNEAIERAPGAHREGWKARRDFVSKDAQSVWAEH
jgi:hypothetical protein